MRPDPAPTWSDLVTPDGEFRDPPFVRKRPLLGGLVDLIETCDCPGEGPCDFPACPRRPIEEEEPPCR